MPSRRLIASLVSSVVAFAAAGATLFGRTSDSAPSILISRQLSRAEHLDVGDTVKLAGDPGGAGARAFRVAGIYEPTPDPMRLAADRFEARLHLGDLADLASEPSGPDGPAPLIAATSINIALHDPASALSFARELLRTVPIPGLIVRTARGGEGSAPVFVVLDRFHLAIALVTLAASTMFLLALMVMVVDERRQAVGILRLIGLRKRRLLLQVLAEGLLVAVAGALFGIALAAGLQGAINAFFQWRYDTTLLFVRITPAIVLRSGAIAVPLGAAASVGASWALLRRNVLDLARR